MCCQPQLQSDGALDHPRQIVLCFDGTAYKFRGDEADSNVLKIFRMLDRNDRHQYHYYQPGFGTAVSSRWLAHHGRLNKAKALYLGAKDAAIGSSFSDHIIGGYKYLMRYYSPQSQVYIFGFSRGAYVARFLVEMIDYIGLVETGNEELVRIVWAAFSRWQKQRNMRETPPNVKQMLYDHMKALRETFCRPVSQVRFVGLFDTVNSIPQLENNWLRRSNFPFTVQAPAKVTRHAVGIDERRTRFRQHLISSVHGTAISRRARIRNVLERAHIHLPHQRGVHLYRANHTTGERHGESKPQSSRSDIEGSCKPYRLGPNAVLGQIESGTTCLNSRSSPRRNPEHQAEQQQSATPGEANSHSSSWDLDEALQNTDRDVEEVWFPGSHADVGGGWNLAAGEDWLVSHVPLVWMVQEAQRAGLRFDTEKLKQFNCWDDRGDASLGQGCRKDSSLSRDKESQDGDQGKPDKRSEFEYALWSASTHGKIHDCLHYDGSIPRTRVFFWRALECLPFRRMDMQQDESWKPIRWPLPLGERRDIPKEARVHVSAIRRMKENPSYRPPNLIEGKGGQPKGNQHGGVGIGDWEVCDHPGSFVRETYRRK